MIVTDSYCMSMEAQALGTASGKTSVMVAAVGAGASRTSVPSVPSVPSAPASTALGCTDLGNGRNTAEAAMEMPLICLSCCLTIRSPTRIAISSAEVTSVSQWHVPIPRLSTLANQTGRS